MTVFKKLKKDDTVKVIAGKDVGKTGRIIRVDRQKGKVLVEGINLVKKTMRKTQQNQVGGIQDVEAFLNISNVMLVCPKCKKATRVGFQFNEKDNSKKRICKKCSADLG
jgi:large subunit ribosomal protein L24